MTVPAEAAAANYVPAAAVIRRQQALFGVTGRKGVCRRLFKFGVKSPGSTGRVRRILNDSSTGEESGIPGVAVKCVDIRRNTGGVDGFLDRN